MVRAALASPVYKLSRPPPPHTCPLHPPRDRRGRAFFHSHAFFFYNSIQLCFFTTPHARGVLERGCSPSPTLVSRLSTLFSLLSLLCPLTRLSLSSLVSRLSRLSSLLLSPSLTLYPLSRARLRRQLELRRLDQLVARRLQLAPFERCSSATLHTVPSLPLPVWAPELHSQ